MGACSIYDRAKEQQAEQQRLMQWKPTTGLIAAVLLGACADATVPFSNAPSFSTPQIKRDAAGLCFGTDVTPALIETVTEQVMVQPAQVNSDGSVTSPAMFRTVTRQAILRERREVQFETICPEAMTPEFIASVQRALLTRGYYVGQITGAMDNRTLRSVQDYQRQNGGHDSPLLDIRTARALGLVQLSAAEIEALG